jgi:hypothetical protein
MRADPALALRRLGWCWCALVAVLIVAAGCAQPGQAASDPGVSTGPASGEASSPAVQPPGSTAGPSTEPAPSTDTPFVTEVPLSWTPPTTPGASYVSPPALTSSASPDTSSHPYVPPPSDVLPAGCPGGTVEIRHSLTGISYPEPTICVRIGTSLHITLTDATDDGWWPLMISPGTAATVVKTELLPEGTGNSYQPHGIRTSTVQVNGGPEFDIVAVAGPHDDEGEGGNSQWTLHVTVRP